MPYKRRRQLQVVELRELEKDYWLMHACLQLAQSPLPETTMSFIMSPSRRADEVVGLLVTVGLFDTAVHICRLFALKMDVIFEQLTIRY